MLTTDFVSKRWVEHVVIGTCSVCWAWMPTARSWLQLEPVSGLEDLAVLAQAEGLQAPLPRTSATPCRWTWNCARPWPMAPRPS